MQLGTLQDGGVAYWAGCLLGVSPSSRVPVLPVIRAGIRVAVCSWAPDRVVGVRCFPNIACKKRVATWLLYSFYVAQVRTHCTNCVKEYPRGYPCYSDISTRTRESLPGQTPTRCSPSVYIIICFALSHPGVVVSVVCYVNVNVIAVTVLCLVCCM